MVSGKTGCLPPLPPSGSSEWELVAVFAETRVCFLSESPSSSGHCTGCGGAAMGRTDKAVFSRALRSLHPVLLDVELQSRGSRSWVA